MKDVFSVEETNLMCIFDTSSKTALLTGLKGSIPDIHDPDMRDIYMSAIEKLEKISDSEFAKIGFYIAEEYTEEMGA